MIWAAAAAVILSGFFSLNGYVLRDVSRRELEATFVGRHARRLDSLLANLHDLQLLCGLLRTISGLVLLVVMLDRFGAYRTDAPRQHLGGIALAVGVTAGLLAIFSVAIPHAWARYSGPRILRGTAGVLLALRLGLWPLVMLMKGFDVPIRRLSGAPEPRDRSEPGGEEAMEEAAKAELIQMAADAQAEGTVAPEEAEMLESVMQFGARRAAEIMTPRTEMTALPVDASAEQVRHMLARHGHSRIPLYDGDIDNIVGVLHVKDLVALEDPRRLELGRLMRKPFFVPETKRLDDLLREFKAGKLHMAIVLDEYGGTAGMVTIEDLIEEIVGEISDEYDRAESPLIKRIDERTIEADGRLRIDELNSALGTQVPENPDYDTVAGLVFSELGFIPPAGETLSVGGAKFTVLAADERRISRVRVELPVQEAEHA